MEAIGDFIIFCILSPEENLRMEPEEALDTIMKLEDEEQFEEMREKVENQKKQIISSTESNYFNVELNPSLNKKKDNKLLLTFQNEENMLILPEKYKNSFEMQEDDQEENKSEDSFQFPSSLKEKI